MKSMTPLFLKNHGVDGMGADEARVLFGKRATLFSLALSEVLIVNVPYMFLGLSTGMDLYRSVFQAVLAMNLTARGKTTPLFAVRDHSRATSVASITARVLEYLELAFAGVERPEGRAEVSMTDQFNVEVCCLPNLMPDGACVGRQS